MLKMKTTKAEQNEPVTKERQRAELLPWRTIQNKAEEVAAYFGFNPIDPSVPGKQDRAYGSSLEKDDPFGPPQKQLIYLEDKIALLRRYSADNWASLPHPLFLVSSASSAGETVVHLDIIGMTGTAAEALLAQTALSILSSHGEKDMRFTLNSVGDRESASDFDRGLNSFIKKNMPLMPDSVKKIIRDNSYAFLNDKRLGESPFADRSPNSISTLSSSAREHFKEVIEYIEALGAPYEMSHSLLVWRQASSQIAFEIRSEEEDKVLAQSIRYSPLTKKMGFKRELPALTCAISIKQSKSAKKKLPEPLFHFVQLSYAAKLQTLPIIECLRKEEIPVLFYLSRDKLSGQLTPSGTAKTPYLLLMGHKEALDKTIIVRNEETRSQEIVAVKDLSGHLHKITKKYRGN